MLHLISLISVITRVPAFLFELDPTKTSWIDFFGHEHR